MRGFPLSMSIGTSLRNGLVALVLSASAALSQDTVYLNSTEYSVQPGGPLAKTSPYMMQSYTALKSFVYDYDIVIDNWHDSFLKDSTKSDTAKQSLATHLRTYLDRFSLEDVLVGFGMIRAPYASIEDGSKVHVMQMVFPFIPRGDNRVFFYNDTPKSGAFLVQGKELLPYVATADEYVSHMLYVESLSAKEYTNKFEGNPSRYEHFQNILTVVQPFIIGDAAKSNANVVQVGIIRDSMYTLEGIRDGLVAVPVTYFRIKK
jgi:hypothetical protein